MKNNSAPQNTRCTLPRQGREIWNTETVKKSPVNCQRAAPCPGPCTQARPSSRAGPPAGAGHNQPKHPGDPARGPGATGPSATRDRGGGEQHARPATPSGEPGGASAPRKPPATPPALGHSPGHSRSRAPRPPLASGRR